MSWKEIESEEQFTVIKPIHRIQHCPYCGGQETFWARISRVGVGRVCGSCGKLYQWEGKLTVDDGYNR